MSTHLQQIASQNVYECVGLVELFEFEILNVHGESFRHDHDLDHDLDRDLDHAEDMFTKYCLSMIFEAVHGQQPKPIVKQVSCVCSFLIL